jgi:hypothetical protein
LPGVGCCCPPEGGHDCSVASVMRLTSPPFRPPVPCGVPRAPRLRPSLPSR